MKENMMSIKEKIIKNDNFGFIYFKIKEYFYKYLISDEKQLRRVFKKKLGRVLELEYPIKYNDKLQWLKLNWYNSLAIKCADKYEVREYVEETIGKNYLNKLLAVYEDVNEIDIDKLPTKFVLKGTHGSGFNIICKDKNKMDWNKEFKKMKTWLKRKYYLSNGEWVYKGVKPRIICEEYLEDEIGQPPMDYKVFCFDGEPKLIQVDIDRFVGHTQQFFTPNWENLEIEIENPTESTTLVEKPDNLEKILELSEKLTKQFPHARADFYNIEGKIIFGEITFFHQSGFGRFNPPEYEIELGSYINLPK